MANASMFKKHAQSVLSKILVMLFTSMLVGIANANPVINKIDAGNANIYRTSHYTLINQSSRQAIISWKSFNIGKNETTRFQQPIGGVTLNRIDASQGASQIYGHLEATG